MKFGYFFFFLSVYCLLFPSSSFAQNKEPVIIDSLLTLLQKAKEDTNKLNLLIEIMKHHLYYKTEDGLKYEKPASELASRLNWQAGSFRVKSNTGRIYWRLGKYDEALKDHFDALSIVEKLGRKNLIVEALTAIGQDYGDNSNYPQALAYFNKALSLAEAQENKIVIAMLYELISWVYGRQGNYPEKTKSDFATLRIQEELNDKYRMAITMANIADDYQALGNDSMALKYLDSSIAPIKAADDLTNLSNTYISMGAIYLKHKNYPTALKYFELALKKGNEIKDIQVIVDAYRNIGAAFVAQGNITEAVKNYLLAAEALRSKEDYQVAAELYIEIGSSYSRLKQYAEAKKYFDEAFILSKKVESDLVTQKYYEGVELLDSSTGNWKDAYTNYKTSIHLRDKLTDDQKTQKMVQTYMQYESDKKDAAARAEQEKKDYRQRTIRNSIIVTLAGTLLFLMVVYRQRNKISTARKRSDELLLNILPAEVAEELKEKGSAEAKLFDEVTVMFTDFKDFTKISEKLSPTELVAEIHNCFKAFDNIIGKYNIEKIKTIGDSYMCAGGLPVLNTTNAKDVVSASIEIQQFMQQNLQQRKSEGKELFEIRIGVHTGPVVAGIVGVKKFAYDIWGDTVNIASRMESSGEAGKINISSCTYELVKDKFNCIYRGKIQAKNKGEIGMYFVECNPDS